MGLHVVRGLALTLVVFPFVDLARRRDIICRWSARLLAILHVFLVGLEEGLLPHREAISAGNVDEERRLMYVGVTRAQKSLHLSYCRKRKRAGETVECQPSRFLAELAQDDLRWAGVPLSADEAAREKAAGAERLKNLKAMLAR